MTYPVKPANHYDYVAFQGSEPTLPLPAPRVAADFDHLKEAADSTIDFIKLFARSDGVIKTEALPSATDLAEYTQQALDAAEDAETAANTAIAAAAAAAASFDQFDDRYLGAKTSDPTLDNDGNPLVTGALYYNSVESEMRSYDGVVWTVLAAGMSQGQGDARYLRLIGGTLTGALVLPNSSPTVDNHAARKKYVDDQITDALAAIASQLPTTGDAKMTLKASADTGWILFNDGTIGDASSGATTRANADCSALFALLWNNVTNTYAAVSGGRGANAAADFAAHKTIATTKVLGRALAIAGAGSGLTSRALGETSGAETVTAEMPAHAHTTARFIATVKVADPGGGGDIDVPRYGDTDNLATTGSAASGDGSISVMQPTSFWNVMVKL